MTTDGLNALQLEYNFLNLTGEVSDSSGDPLATYTWLADGTKVGVVDDDGHGLEYTGSLIYKRNGTSLELESTSFGGGRIEVSEGTSGNIYTPNYFLTDHLGSTRAVVTPNGTVRERNDYHPFGLRWSNSGTQISDNRFRFSGKENQTTGDLPYQDFGARMYDSRIARMRTLDRFAEKYGSLTPYGYAAGNPANIIDINGDSLWMEHRGARALYVDGALYNQNGSEFTGKQNRFIRKTVNALNTINGTSTGSEMITKLQSSHNDFTIYKSGENRFESSNVVKAYGQQHIAENTPTYQMKGNDYVSGGSGGSIFWNPSGANVQTIGGLSNNPAIVLGHEMAHGWDADRGLLNSTIIDGSPKSEWQAVYNENSIRGQLGLPLRSHYGAIIVNGIREPRTRMLTPANKPLLRHVYP
jgi:RHS repeat-associated protein